MPALRRLQILLSIIILWIVCAVPCWGTEDRPNILWISAEDLSPDLGCYGVAYAHTPNLDRLASQGARYMRAFSISGVCAPSRSAIITGMYPTSIGTHHMRCKGIPPAHVKCFPEYLRAAGYYCTNNRKTDYNFDAPVSAWDESSNTAHWRNRPESKPFFSVINLTTTHESQIRCDEKRFARHMSRVADAHRHDPAEAELPPYYPDTPIVRNDWARYHDLVTSMDAQVAEILRQLEEDGLAGSTIVFFWGDHGRGLPRAKRWIYDSGLHVPLIIRWPGGIEPGSVVEELVSFVDFGPTVLSLAGVPVPEYMQGQAFLGEQCAAPREYIYAARDRMDETYDIIRAVRDKRFKYIRNYQPEKPYAQYIGYMELMPTMQEMRRLNKAGELVGSERQYFSPEKPREELYDTVADPHEVNNLADDWRYRDVLQRMRAAMDEWRDETNDLGLILEAEIWEKRRPGGKWATTAKPTFELKGKGGGDEISIECDTPGASIVYRYEDAVPERWVLYTGPFRMKSDTLRAKAIRLGYRESATARFRLP